MVNRVFAGLVIAFWSAMMTALVRIEVFPGPAAVETFPTERVMQKIFSNHEPVRLDVWYGGDDIGSCTIDIQPQETNTRLAEDSTSDPEAGSYKVTSTVKLRLSSFGASSQLWLEGESWFNKNLDLEHFELWTRIGGGRRGRSSMGDPHIEVIGDDRANKVQVTFGFGDFHDRRSFDFSQIKGAGFANTLGLPGLANFGLLGGGLPSAFAPSSTGGARSRPETVTYVDHLEIADSSQRAYLVYSKIDDQMWTKIWVDDSGQVLRVATSIGLEMRTGVPFGMSAPVDRAASRPH